MSEITITGLQHIGLPTNDMKAKLRFTKNWDLRLRTVP